MDLNYDGLMVETHCAPDNALTDAAQQVTPDSLIGILSNLVIRDELPSLGSMDELTRLRKRINNLDDELLKVLARRADVSRNIGIYKKENNMSILQAKRWKSLMSDHLQQARRNNMNEKFVNDLFKLIHQDSIDIQEAVLTGSPQRNDR